ELDLLAPLLKEDLRFAFVAQSVRESTRGRSDGASRSRFRNTRLTETMAWTQAIGGWSHPADRWALTRTSTMPSSFARSASRRGVSEGIYAVRPGAEIGGPSDRARLPQIGRKARSASGRVVVLAAVEPLTQLTAFSSFT